MTKARFKAGDRVRCVRSFERQPISGPPPVQFIRQGLIYDVQFCQETPEGVVLVVSLDGRGQEVDQDRFEKVFELTVSVKVPGGELFQSKAEFSPSMSREFEHLMSQITRQALEAFPKMLGLESTQESTANRS